MEVDLRNRMLADGHDRTQAALRVLKAIAGRSHAELVCEAIEGVLLTIEVARSDAELVNSCRPDEMPVTNDDLVELLRLRLVLLAALDHWRTQT